MKGTHSYRPRDFWLYDILINEERQKSFKVSNLKDFKSKFQ